MSINSTVIKEFTFHVMEGGKVVAVVTERAKSLKKARAAVSKRAFRGHKLRHIR